MKKLVIFALSLLCNIQFRKAHEDLSESFTETVSADPNETRNGMQIHGRQFWEVLGTSYYFNYFVFGWAKISNVLPEYVVVALSIFVFEATFIKNANIVC